MKKIILLAVSLVLSSCTNFWIRQECKDYNWYQLGYDAAMRGERASNDAKIMRCRSAEAEMSESQIDTGFKAGMARYCQPDTAYQIGKQGETLNYDFCDSNILGTMKRRFQEGNTAYCKDGYTAGQTGIKYKNVCSAELEKIFMPEYKKGRKKFLLGKIEAAEIERREVNLELDRVSYEKRIVDQRLSILPLVQDGQKDPYFSERSNLNSQSSSLSSRLSSVRYKKENLDRQIQEYRAESAALD